MLAGDNVGLISSRQQSQQGEWALAGATRAIIESCAISNKTKEINYLFPLYLYPEKSADDTMELGMAECVPNLAVEFTAALEVRTGLRYDPSGVDDTRTTFVPRAVLGYIYAILHSPEYRHRYADFLRTDFPRIPLPGSREDFMGLARLGTELIGRHLLDLESTDRPTFDVEGTGKIDNVKYVEPAGEKPGQVWINDTQCFNGVTPETWNFTVGSYRPAEKWLKDRRGQKLTITDIELYRQICAALADTPRLMQRIDRVIQASGGWTAAASTQGTDTAAGHSSSG